MRIAKPLRTGWTSRITTWSLAALVFLILSGLVVTFAPFHGLVEWTVLVHTAVGLLALIPVIWYLVSHWLDYKHFRLTDVVLLGYLGSAALLLCLISGAVVTWQGLLGPKMSPLWRNLHLYSTFAVLAVAGAHGLLVWLRGRSRVPRPAAAALAWRSLTATLGGAVAVAALFALYPGDRYVNEFPDDYAFPYGEDRPFAPSLAVTSTGGAFDPRSLAGSETCGSAGCHTQILEEWLPSAHRYAAMDPLFQKVQSVMAEQNGPESTRYCGGCHDPISLFSGTKNIFVEDLTGLDGYQEGISCLACHGVRETDLQGNANYVMAQPASYLWQWHEEGAGKLLSDFLVRTYPDEHRKLSKRMFKAPEYCAACHKQFIDAEVNRVGWVQLQNQYDNWKASHWFVEGDPGRTIECRECHMPLVESTDPASGDVTDYNRTASDGLHRSHRFIGANSLVPAMLELEGWEEQVRLTRQWLRGELRIPEISEKWTEGPVVQMALEAPETVTPGQRVPIRLVLTANKVGHDFPTGPLDIIQSWVELKVFDESGEEVYSSGTVDQENFIEPGSFLFKAEPVDQYGNLIDRHNLWEMVGVRYRRALFPGYSDTVEYSFDCPTTMVVRVEEAERRQREWERQELEVPRPETAGRYRVVARLMYRKVDQFLINFLLGEDSGLTAPIIEMTTTETTFDVVPRSAELGAEALGAPAGAG
ncbi:MAG: multiheme c-type cytochrome [Thermoanaerobaculia bacterium]|nr:multiheme c-type cytochrome [Thermoanaerobaculia bacterium]